MKKSIIIILSIFVAFAANDCIAASSTLANGTTVSASISSKEKKKKELKTVVLSANIHCKNCATKIKENLGFEKGVTDLDVSVEKKQVSITYDVAKINLDTILAAMKKLGYPASVVSE